MPVLSQAQLEHLVAIIAVRRDSSRMKYVNMGGDDGAREDAVLVIRVDDRSITADLRTDWLLTFFPRLPRHTQSVHPRYRRKQTLICGEVLFIELTGFDHENGPNGPQHSSQKATPVFSVKPFGAE
ncbi:Protein of unknown function DUF1814 [Penicillium coprophilum]|uniref:Protein of unknown function DUF1814 n=1 Tax=Penicillium coprophilum TaxID=36646 RepID=UPI00238FC663|nr:Protein of unknown function DUF1814 [Penicillium coprophilum]KAJ5153895.1 Protein of unknown function DUF1814 [Penicillium coprophilum]